MLKFTLKRVLKGILCVWFIWSLIFFMVRLTGDPTDWMLPDGASDAEIAKLRASMHLDEPLSKQYIDSLTDLFRGEAGQSYYYKRDVTGLYAERLTTTLKLAVPAFCLGIIMIFIFSMKLNILPSFGTGTPLHLVMPMITLAASPMATIARLTRSSMLDTMSREYIDGARMKGIGELALTIRHGLRNSLIPVVTGVGMQLGTILGGAVVVENVFTWPGMGMLLVTAAKQRDFPTVQFGVLIVALSVTITNILIDISYGWLDPRIRESFK